MSATAESGRPENRAAMSSGFEAAETFAAPPSAIKYDAETLAAPAPASRSAPRPGIAVEPEVLSAPPFVSGVELEPEASAPPFVSGPEVELEPEASASAKPVTISRGRLILRRFLRRRLAVAGLAVLVLMFLLAFLGPYLTQWDYKTKDYDNMLAGPSASHWFGTTQIGGDVYAETLRGLQKSLIIGLLAAVLSTGLSAVVGAAAGYFGGWPDRVLTWFVDLLLVLPSFLILAINSQRFRGKTWLLFVLLLALFNWMITARMVRGMARSLREREFVTAAEIMGVHPVRIIGRHLLPNMASLLIIDATINVGGMILSETALSYFGFGVQPPDVSLGTILADNTDAALTSPWLFYPAAIALIVTVLAVALVGDGLRDALDAMSTNVTSDQREAA